VKLLFGNETDSGREAKEAIDALWSGRDALERKPPEAGTALAASSEAYERLYAFT
jgi:hypothetical protein